MKTKNTPHKQAIMLTQMSQRKAIKEPLAKKQSYLQTQSDRDTTGIYQSSREDSETRSIKSAASRIIYMKKSMSKVVEQTHKLKQKDQDIQVKQNQCDSSYEILDLTYTFINCSLNKVLIGIVFVLLLLIRYYTFGCLMYVMLANYVRHWKWIFVVFLNRFLYISIVVKISLKIPQNKTQLILKKNWNCMESQVHQYFQIINAKKLITSVLRGLVPSELSFFYIKSQTRMKKFQIYSAINFIYTGIQCIIYYPFFIVYMNYINSDNSYALNVYNVNLTVIIALFAEIIMACLTIYFVGVGIYRRYGTMGKAIKDLCSWKCCQSDKKKEAQN